MSRFGLHAVAALMTFTASASAHAAEGGIEGEPQTSATVTALYYAMPDQSDFFVGVASINRGPLRFEARYNYEARDAASAFLGWKFAGGDAVTFEITPIAGVLFGAAKAVIPGVEASIAYRTFDAYVEAEYVSDLEHHADSYFYAWIELGWRPVEWLRVGLVGQRTRVVEGDRDIQRGIFGQLTFRNTTLGLYAFNPDSGSRYVIVSIAATFP